ncbi:MAG TPA: hypothetical protein PKN50_18660 [Spirochaetota bacterium]|nr:hypothetical protein [Spirochaetota bacterium]
MNNKYFTRVLPMAILALCVAFTGFTGCAGGDIATVTVSVKHPDLARTYTPSFFDRMIAFFSLGTRAEAGPPTGGLTFERMRLFVSGPDIAPINTQIPMNEGKITVSVPSGKNILFRVKADGSGTTYDYAGQVLTDLAPGESKAIAIDMKPAIYMGGIRGLDACYWINGELYEITEPNSRISALTVFNDTVYCAGYYSDPSMTPCYWENQTKHDLTYGLGATSIFVTAGNIYIGVNADNSGGYFVNGQYNPLTDNGQISGISVYNGKVYAYGYDEKRDLAYWVQGVKTNIGISFNENTLKGMFISGGDVYLCGNSNSPNQPFYFKNTTPHYLEPEGTNYRAQDIAVVGDDVYVAGYYIIDAYRNQACYWKNGIRTDIANPIGSGVSSEARAIAIRDGDVYMAGNFSNDQVPMNTACFWKNGVRYNLESEDSNSSASCLFVY